MPCNYSKKLFTGTAKPLRITSVRVSGVLLYQTSIELHQKNAHFVFNTYLYPGSSTCFGVSHTAFRENLVFLTQKYLLYSKTPTLLKNTYFY